MKGAVFNIPLQDSLACASVAISQVAPDNKGVCMSVLLHLLAMGLGLCLAPRAARAAPSYPVRPQALMYTNTTPCLDGHSSYFSSGSTPLNFLALHHQTSTTTTTSARIYGHIPVVVAKTGLFLKENGENAPLPFRLARPLEPTPVPDS